MRILGFIYLKNFKILNSENSKTKTTMSWVRYLFSIRLANHGRKNSLTGVHVRE